MEEISQPVDLTESENLIKACTTSLASKVVSQHSQQLAPMAVEAIKRTVNLVEANNVDLKNIKINKKLGGTLEDSELVDGLAFVKYKVTHQAQGPTRIQNPKIGVITFWLSAPKTDIEEQVVVQEYTAMDRLLREERKHILEMCKKI